jgi:hypothetical protein
MQQARMKKAFRQYQQHRSEGPLFWVACTICKSEAPAWFNANNRPDISPKWRGVSAACCERHEVYVCSPKCLAAIARRLMSEHTSDEVRIRRVEPLIDKEAIWEMLEDCSEADIARGLDGSPGFSEQERAFLESCRNELANHDRLSAKQAEALRELWDRI